MEHKNTGSACLKAVPVITAKGNRSLMIENHKGIINIEKDRIAISTSIGKIVICGSVLMTEKFDKDIVMICGHINSISIS